jgi:hypothetical protein
VSVQSSFLGYHQDLKRYDEREIVGRWHRTNGKPRIASF